MTEELIILPDNRKVRVIDGETTESAGAVCPYCGYLWADYWDFMEDGRTTVEDCPECNRRISVTSEVSCTFTARRMEEGEDEG